jgi:hypothetical protein
MTAYRMKAYLFRDKDPVIDQLRTMAEDQFGSRVSRKMLQNIEDKGGPRLGTMGNWFFGAVKRPQSATVEGCGRALGYERKWIKRDGKGKG